MKFPMYKKEPQDKDYHNGPFRAVNFGKNEEENIMRYNGKKVYFAYWKSVKGSGMSDKMSTTPVKTAIVAHIWRTLKTGQKPDSQDQ